MSRDIVITCAVTGGADTLKLNPAVPVAPSEIARECLEAAEAGAAVVHIHVRDPETGRASMNSELYAEVFERIREKNEEILINLTTGAGARFDPGDPDPARPAATTNFRSPEERVRHIEMLRPDICSLDIGTMNFGSTVFVNTGDHIARMAQRIRAAGVKPELEVFDLGHLRQAVHLLDTGMFERPPLLQLCMGIPWGAPATIDAIQAMARHLPKDAMWSAFGISQHQRPIVAMAVLLGGNVRVGLEDNLYLDKGVLAPGNAALVEQAVAIIHSLGHRVASPARARDLFALPARQDVRAEQAS
jgi:uncharacterized protein (DUF849 family)